VRKIQLQRDVHHHQNKRRMKKKLKKLLKMRLKKLLKMRLKKKTQEMEMEEMAMAVETMEEEMMAAAKKNNKNTITSPKDSPTPMEIIEVTSNSILENAFRTNSQ
jgi:hypothetical protein